VKLNSPQIFRADLVVEVPEDIDTSRSMFSFFKKYNVVEFKSENDRFTWRKYLVNQVRTALFLVQTENVEMQEVLTVFILSQKRSFHCRSGLLPAIDAQATPKI
jgi:hypothetical protein